MNVNTQELFYGLKLDNDTGDFVAKVVFHNGKSRNIGGGYLSPDYPECLPNLYYARNAYLVEMTRVRYGGRRLSWEKCLQLSEERAISPYKLYLKGRDRVTLTFKEM